MKRAFLEDRRCPHCKASDARLHGRSRAGIQRYRCIQCSKTFQKKYIYSGNQEKSALLLTRQ